MPNVIVYGWYNRGNMGDELMKRAFSSILEPHGFSVTFVDSIDKGVLSAADVIVFGGGCILHDDPSVDAVALDAMLSKRIPVFYVGIGLETDVSPMHQKLLNVAELIVTRSYPASAPQVCIPDLAYSLAPELVSGSMPVEKNGVLVITNVEVLPKHSDPHWMHVSWEHFKNEMAQCLDRLVELGVEPTFVGMCKNDRHDDTWPAAELVGRMKFRKTRYSVKVMTSPEDLVVLMRSSKVVYTQRYHGIVLAEIAGVPYVSIDHHDKLKLAHPSDGQHVGFHSATKDQLLSSFDAAVSSSFPTNVPDRSVYDELVTKIEGILERDPPR